MVEQAHAGERHGDAVFVAAIDYNIIANRAAGLCNVLNTASLGSLDVVIKREERI